MKYSKMIRLLGITRRYNVQQKAKECEAFETIRISAQILKHSIPAVAEEAHNTSWTQSMYAITSPLALAQSLSAKNNMYTNEKSRLHRCCREVVLVPKELIVFNHTAHHIQKRLVLELPCDAVYPCPTTR